MKTTLLAVVAGSVGLLTAPALAGNSKKHERDSKRTAKLAIEQAVPAPAPPAEVATASPLPSATELEDAPAAIVLPDLPADTRTALNQLPELEARVQTAVIAKRAATATRSAKAKAKAPLMKMGDTYVLGTKRESAQPGRDVEQIVPKGLSQAQVATVIQSHMTEIQDCWNLVPKAQRADACTADLRLSIADSGSVTDIELEGVPASAHKCMSSVISKWQFPVAETHSDIDYGIALRTLD